MTPPVRLLISSLLSLVLSACGGGSDTPGAGSTPSGKASSTVLPYVPVAIPASSYAAGSAELGGWNVLQRARVLCGFGALSQNLSLDRSALSHARYLTSISVGSGVSEFSFYDTITTNPYYT